MARQKDAVEDVFRTTIRLIELEAGGDEGVFPQGRVDDFFRVGIELVEGDLSRHRIEGSEVRRIREAVTHRGCGGIELIHRRQAEDELDRSDDTGLIVLGRNGLAALGVGAHDEGCGSVSAHMIPAGLGIVLDRDSVQVSGQNLHLVRSLDNATKSQIVVGHVNSRKRVFGGGSSGVIIGEVEEDEIRKLIGFLELFELFDELGGADEIGHVEIPADRIEFAILPEALDAGLAS